jgi:hypothetical protein
MEGNERHNFWFAYNALEHSILITEPQATVW